MDHARFVDALTALYGPDAIDHLSVLVTIAKNDPEALTRAVEAFRPYEPTPDSLYKVTLDGLMSPEFTFKISAIKAIREELGYCLRESKEFVESLPRVIRTNMPKAAAMALADKFRKIGGIVTINTV